MTIQVGIRCADGSIVMAGDTKVRTTQRHLRATEPPDTLVHRSKIAYAERHDIAVAMAGDGAVGTDAAKELAEHLSSLEPVPDFLGPILTQWGNEYFQRNCPTEQGNREYPLCSMLVVNPKTEYCPFWKLYVNCESREEAAEKYMVNGHEPNPAVFWLEYMKADKGHVSLLSLEAMTGIAITTILMAGELNPYGIGGLEIHQYHDGRWDTWARKQTERTEFLCADAQERIKELVLGLGVRPAEP